MAQLRQQEHRAKGKPLGEVLYMDQGPELLEIINIHHQTPATDELFSFWNAHNL